MGIFKFDEIAFNSTEKKKPVDEDKYTYLGLEHLDSDSIYVTRYGADVAPKGDKLIMKKGDVLFGKRRAYQKKVAIAPFDGIFSAHGMVLRPKEDVIDKDFFPMFIKSDYFLDAAIKISVGSLSPTINWRDLKELKFELPSLEEQRKLAEVLWAIYDMKDKYKKLILATDELVKSQFIEMFGDTLTDQSVYKVVPLASVFDKPQGGEWGKDDPDSTGVPVLRTTNFTDEGIIDFTDVATRIILLDKVEKKSLSKGDILIEKSGGSNDKPVGRVVYFESDDNTYLNNNFTAKLHLNGIFDLNSFYVFKFMFVNYWMGGTKIHEGKTTGIHNIRLNDYLEKTYIPLAPRSIQDEYVELAEQSDKSKFALQEAIKDLDALSKKIIAENLIPAGKE
ncbi:restriction endonuclease subunit S [Stomatobaculum longum]|uniref:restriction endonuclease subunit S n=1 Tax=Stomatobaculum longum TaxID=796942 RepID=UPI0028046626|nr:restriction endonuclease subunit S [Stomatobaculum longum]